MSANRIETASNITLIVSRGGEKAYPGYVHENQSILVGKEGQNSSDFLEIPISRLDTTKEIEINEVREGTLKASGYTITNISYSGTMTFKGSKVTKTLEDGKDKGSDPTTVAIENLLYTADGVPKPVTITIQHDLNGGTEVYKNVLVNSESYEARAEDATETAFDWIAMDRKSDQP